MTDRPKDAAEKIAAGLCALASYVREGKEGAFALAVAEQKLAEGLRLALEHLDPTRPPA